MNPLQPHIGSILDGMQAAISGGLHKILVDLHKIMEMTRCNAGNSGKTYMAELITWYESDARKH